MSDDTLKIAASVGGERIVLEVHEGEQALRDMNRAEAQDFGLTVLDAMKVSGA